MSFLSLPSLNGFYIDKVPSNIVELIKKDVDTAMNNNDVANNYLAGNIIEEYYLPVNKEIDQYIFYIADELTKNLPEYKDRIQKLLYSNVEEKDKPIKMVSESRWVNRQKKYEFNPIHKHSGILSYVIWLDIPYTREEEHKASPGMNSHRDKAGLFEFYYTDGFGQMAEFEVTVDRLSEVTIAMFPSSLNHSVYPFYSTDKERVTVAGNIGLVR